MTITDEQLKGNWGEQYIASNLASQGCFIRHITQGHDSGIDLYCETIKDGNPFLHFWCQVKTSKKWKGRKEQVTCPPLKKHKDYWLNQPVPVFIFLVPDLRDKTNVPYYICRVLDLLDKDKINSSVRIKSATDLSVFLNERLVIETFLWELKNGMVSSLKNPKKKYTRQFPSGLAHKFEPKLYQSLRWTLWRLSEDMLFHDIDKNNILEKTILNDDEKKRFESAKPYMKALEILIKSKNDKHYENYSIIGTYYEIEHKYEMALKYYKQSLSIIDGDRNIDKSEGLWKDIREKIYQHIERVESKISRAMRGDSLPGY